MGKKYIKARVWIIPILIISVAIGAACGRVENDLEGIETQVIPQTTLPEATLAVADELPTPQEPAHMASGLVLSSPSETFYVDVNGQVVSLVDQPHAQLSETRDQVLFAREDPSNYKSDIWLLDLESGQEHNLTQTSDRDEIFPQWWPAHPEIVFFESGEETGMMNNQLPTIVNLDGSGYRVLDENRGGPTAFSPTGESIAYGGFGQDGIIYHWSGDLEVFDPVDYGLNVEKIYQPAFSPDGRYLAWKVAGDLNGDGVYAIGLAIFDLQEHTAIVIHVYTVQGGGMVPHYVSWSPDGNWIAYVTFGEEPAVGREPNLWILRPDGSQEMYIDAGLNPVWGLDSQSLAYIRTTLEGEIGLQIIGIKDLRTKAIDDLQFPDSVNFIMDWIQP
ncbi:MAG: hypothetical protein WBB64_04645 [Anaerolineales bacterium]